MTKTPMQHLRVDGATRLVLILGDPIAQARSPEALSAALAARGRNALVVPAHVPPEAFDRVMSGLEGLRNLDGLILTVPHKAAGLDWCREVTTAARLVGGVNVLRRVEGGWIGDQCDGRGFVQGLRRAGLVPEGRSVLLVGAGGAGSAIAVALVEAGVTRLAIHDSRPDRAAALVAQVAAMGEGRAGQGGATDLPSAGRTAAALTQEGPPDPTGFDLVINATPLGMAAGDPLPLETSGLQPSQTVADVVPRPAVTPLLTAARSRGCRIVTGLDMYEGVGEAILGFLYDTLTPSRPVTPKRSTGPDATGRAGTTTTKGQRLHHTKGGYMKHLLTAVIGAGLLAAAPAAADFPTRDLQGVIQWGAGGATDTVARALQPFVEEELVRRVIMTNRTGGGGAIAVRYVKSQPPDGYTLLVGAENPQIYKVLGIADVDYGDFHAVNIPTRGVVVISTPADSRWQNFDELLAEVQANPGTVRMGGTGPGGLVHVTEAMILSVTDFDVITVPYDGEGPGLTAMLGGAVDFMPTGLSAAYELIRAGRVRPLAVLNTEVIPQLPDTAPITDSLPDLAQFLPWGPFYGFFVRRGTPAEAIERLEVAFATAAASETFTTMMLDRGNVMMNIAGAEADDFLARWQSVTSWLLYETGAAENSPEQFGIPRP